jgi:hypothetical protein
VNIKLVVLGFDPRMWGDLENFKGVVVDCYYQEISGSPMFTVDFGGSIGKREVRVCGTAVADTRGGGGLTQWAFNFGSLGSSSRGASIAAREERSSRSPRFDPALPPLHPNAPLLSDSDVDLDWLGDFEDFQLDANIPSSSDSFLGEPPTSSMNFTY